MATRTVDESDGKRRREEEREEARREVDAAMAKFAAAELACSEAGAESAALLDRRLRSVDTVLGSVPVEMARRACRECGRSWRPRERLLGVEGSMTPSARRLAGSEASCAPQDVDVCVGDGAEWIRRLFDDWFPDAVAIVDSCHAAEYLWAAARARHDAGGDLAAAWARRLCGMLSKCVGDRSDGNLLLVLVRDLRGQVSRPLQVGDRDGTVDDIEALHESLSEIPCLAGAVR